MEGVQSGAVPAIGKSSFVPQARAEIIVIILDFTPSSITDENSANF